MRALAHRGLGPPAWLAFWLVGMNPDSAGLHAAPVRPPPPATVQKPPQGSASPSLAAGSGADRSGETPVLVEAPVTAATVYSGSARVARSVRLTLSGSVSRLRFPPLCGHVDASSLRVDVKGHAATAEVARIEIETPLLGDLKSTTDSLPIAEVKRLIDALEGIDDDLSRVAEEESAVQRHQDLLSSLSPTVPPLPQSGGKGSPLNPAGWGTGLAFLRSRQEALHRRSQDLDEQRFELQKKRQQIEQSLRTAHGGQGWTTPRRCLQVSATLRGHGVTDVWLSYRTRGASWEPTYDIQLQPDRSRVELAFAGQVSQSSGEDWDAVLLSLSTAVPGQATQLPKLVTWKLGASERFVPTPNRVHATPAPPPTPVPPLPPLAADASLRQRLLALLSRSLPTGRTQAAPDAGLVAMGDISAPPADRDDDGILDQRDAEEERRPKTAEKDLVAREVRRRPQEQPPPPAPVVASSAPAQRARYTQLAAVRPAAAPETSTTSFERADEAIMGSLAKPPVQVLGVGLSPPPGYVPPSLDPRSAAARAGGYDLTYSSLYRESLGSGKGARRVALFSRSFPVRVLRKIFPALTQDAYLVAMIQNPPSSEGGQPLPGGSARLFVGADPAGQAELGLVAAGERFTLPLGIDRALKPIRNVHLSTQEKGVFNKDEITQYEVVTELANPYRTPIDVQLIDQLPLAGDKQVELKLLSISPPPSPPQSPPSRKPPAGWTYADSPYASVIDPTTGAVEWRLTLPAGGKIETRFQYTLRRPKGARLYQ